ncbi:hypothetical protein UT300017_15570 [Clostridium sp. CTA-17]
MAAIKLSILPAGASNSILSIKFISPKIQLGLSLVNLLNTLYYTQLHNTILHFIICLLIQALYKIKICIDIL